ncbi:MAG: single-stranded-DNA-specific exonuclease RecJ [Oceanococcus sp.]
MAALTTRLLKRREAVAEPLLDIENPVLRRVFSHRGLANAQRGGLAELLPWQQLKDIDVAASCVCAAIEQQQRILIVGDYDADGATGVALAVSALRAFGAREPAYLVPDRVRMGYGLSPALAALALQQTPDLVITVDNGISSVEGVAALKLAGVRVVITDHHLPGEQLPQADAIVNPNQAGCAFPSKALSGVGVMFYLMLALRHALQQAAWFSAKPPNMAQYLDLVALGTVADLVALDSNNRLLVDHGIRRMRAGLARPGVQALIEVAGRKQHQLLASDLGFALGPRINAAGRLEHMDRGIACLLSEDAEQAQALAAELDEINRQRRALQTDMQELALEQLPDSIDESAAALCLQDERWHEGIVGLIASQLKERFHRPVIAFAPAADGSLKGSGRSISGFHLRDALALLDARHPGLIGKFGGHAMAAGLSLPAASFASFQQAFELICSLQLSAETLQAHWYSDGELAADDLSSATALSLREAGPWGQAWEEPLFDGEFEVLSQRIVGQGHLKLRLRPAGQSQSIDAIAFGVDEELIGPQHLVYQLQLNDYYNPAQLQLLIRGRAG